MKLNKYFTSISVVPESENYNESYWFCFKKKQWVDTNICRIEPNKCDDCEGFSTDQYVRSYRGARRKIKKHSKYLPDNLEFYVNNRYMKVTKKGKNTDGFDRKLKVKKWNLYEKYWDVI